MSSDVAKIQSDDQKRAYESRAAYNDLSLTATQFTRATYLMCSPEWFEIRYVINPWMAGNVGSSRRDAAFRQWKGLYTALNKFGDVRLMQAQPNLPDMTFVAHGALVQLGVAALSSFGAGQRRPEQRFVQQWLESTGFLPWRLPEDVAFEGEGDAMFSPTGDRLWVAHGARTSHVSHRHLRDAWKTRLSTLHLIDPRFFHLDTCFAPLSGGHLLYFPGAFDAASRRTIESIYPVDRRIEVSEAEAVQFTCNVINAGSEVVMHAAKGSIGNKLRRLGYRVTELPLDEFIRSGGSAKSLALRLSDLTVTHRTGLRHFRKDDRIFEAH